MYIYESYIYGSYIRNVLKSVNNSSCILHSKKINRCYETRITNRYVHWNNCKYVSYIKNNDSVSLTHNVWSEVKVERRYSIMAFWFNHDISILCTDKTFIRSDVKRNRLLICFWQGIFFAVRWCNCVMYLFARNL